MHCLPREVLWKRNCHSTSTQFWLRVIRWVRELYKQPSYMAWIFIVFTLVLPKHIILMYWFYMWLHGHCSHESQSKCIWVLTWSYWKIKIGREGVVVLFLGGILHEKERGAYHMPSCFLYSLLSPSRGKV